MKFRNNLAPELSACYYRVTKEFSVFCPRQMYLAQTFVGASQAYGNIFYLVRLEVGDEVHDTPGGVFVAPASEEGSRFEARMSISQKGLFEKSYGGDYEVWPLECLEEIPKEREYETLRPVVVDEPFGSPVGRSDDRVVCGPDEVFSKGERLYPKANENITP